MAKFKPEQLKEKMKKHMVIKNNGVLFMKMLSDTIYHKKFIYGVWRK